MKRLMGFLLCGIMLASCSDEGTGNRTDNMTDAAEQHNPASNPNPQSNTAQDTSVGTGDTSTVVSYDTSSRASGNQ